MRLQPYTFGLGDNLLAQAGGVPLDALHRDVDAICHCNEAIRPLAARLGVEPPRPRLAGFSYSHVSALGAPVVFPEGSEPNVHPIIQELTDIDALHDPKDFLDAGIVPERLRTLEALRARRPDAALSIGHLFEGPATTAALLMGPAFFTLPYEDPERAHRLLTFCVDSAVRYAQTLQEHLGKPIQPGPKGIPDDFAGILPPGPFEVFVAPYWDRMYSQLDATERHLHSELLRKGHLPFLKELGIAVYDPSADQYVTPELLRAHCPVPFTCRIQSWHIRDKSVAQLQEMYRNLASFEPVTVSFYMTSLEQEEKISAILEVARALAGE